MGVDAARRLRAALLRGGEMTMPLTELGHEWSFRIPFDAVTKDCPARRPLP